jgi:IstB-like ATP binding protein
MQAPASAVAATSGVAFDAGMTVAWFTIDDLGALIRRHRVDDSVSKAITRITRTDLIIVDDIGLLPVSPDAAEGFYRLIEAAYERRSLAVSSNKQFGKAVGRPLRAPVQRGRGRGLRSDTALVECRAMRGGGRD